MRELARRYIHNLLRAATTARRAELDPQGFSHRDQTVLVFFDRDRATLTPRAAAIVAEAARSAQVQTTTIEVDGYADTSRALPGERGRLYNLRLSLRRAQSGRVALVREGMPAGGSRCTGSGTRSRWSRRARTCASRRTAGWRSCCGEGFSRRTVLGIGASAGEMAEWFKAHAWKACVRESVPWVRIPLSPPIQSLSGH